MGGSVIHDYIIEKGCLLFLFDEPIKIGYTFIGWYKEDSCINIWNFISDTVDTNMTLYAKWIKIPSFKNSTINSNIKFYPNPVSDDLKISGIAMQQITIYNLSGKAVMQINTRGKDKVSIDMGNLISGMYFVQVITGRPEAIVLKLQKR